MLLKVETDWKVARGAKPVDGSWRDILFKYFDSGNFGERV